jgi:hypothetical protein
MSATDNNQTKGDLIPLSSRILRLCYGSDEYLRSVFGTEKITRQDIADYYTEAKLTWHKVPVKWAESWRNQIPPWLRQADIKNLDYFFPIGHEGIWFKYEHDAFAFTLKFGIIDKNYHFQYN